jgi:hypothetical protein
MIDGFQNDILKVNAICGCIHDTTNAFVDPSSAWQVWKLQRSISGLNQASWSWNFCFDEVVKSFGFIKNDEEAYVYSISVSALPYLIWYVDDILLIGNDIPFVKLIHWKIVFQLKTWGRSLHIRHQDL